MLPCPLFFFYSYANVKKCSNEGRALMQLDFQQFLMKLEKLTDLRPVPDKEFVETYIKAYYLTENDMEQFIKNHRVSQVDVEQSWRSFLQHASSLTLVFSCRSTP